MEKYLYNLGLDDNKVGYNFLLEAIELINNDKVLILHICKVYDAIGKKYNKSRQYVERSLQNLFNHSFLTKRKTKDQLIFILNDLKKKKLI